MHRLAGHRSNPAACGKSIRSAVLCTSVASQAKIAGAPPVRIPCQVAEGPTADLPATGVAQLIQKLFGRDQIGSAETLRQAAVDRLKTGDGVGVAALIGQ